MKYLEYLEISSDGCYDFHDPVYLPSVKSLQLYCFNNSYCLTCIENLIKSLPNVKKLENYTRDAEIIHLQNKYLTKLKKIWIDLPTNLNNNILMQPNLREVNLKDCLTSKNNDQLFKIVDSRLTNLTLKMDLEKEELAVFVQKLFEHFPNLNYLHLDARRYDISIFIPHLNLTPKLRVLFLDRSVFRDKDIAEVKEAFKKGENLFVIRKYYNRWITETKWITEM